MSPLIACLWGLAGAGAVEALDLYTAIRRTKGYPWRQPDEVALGPYLLSVVIRLGLGVLAATLCAASNQIAGPAGAFAAGFAAPKLFEQFARLPHTGRNTEYLPPPREVTRVVGHPETSHESTVEAGGTVAAPPDGGSR